jgi:GT2 family glycosyltransferase
MKYSIIMPYYNRANQLYNSLGSFYYHYKDRDDFEVIIIVDGKTKKETERLNELKTVINCFNLHMNIVHIYTNYEDCWNPAPLFCDGVEESNGEFLVLTNPEVFHKSNILHALDGEFMKDKDTYVVCACENVKIDRYYEDVTNMDDFKYEHIMWYQHSKHRNRMLHFCTAISREQYDKIGGFDRRYMYGAAVEDVDFVEKVKKSGMPIIVRDDLVTLHQDHGKAQDIIPNYDKLWNINKNLYSAIHG